MIQTFAHRIDRIKSLLGGMEAYADSLQKWGITTEFITEMKTQYDQVNENEQKRNSLKSSAQQLTVSQDELMAALENKAGMVKKIVRYELSKECWPEFGFREGEWAAQTATEDDQTT